MHIPVVHLRKDGGSCCSPPTRAGTGGTESGPSHSSSGRALPTSIVHLRSRGSCLPPGASCTEWGPAHSRSGGVLSISIHHLGIWGRGGPLLPPEPPAENGEHHTGGSARGGRTQGGDPTSIPQLRWGGGSLSPHPPWPFSTDGTPPEEGLSPPPACRPVSKDRGGSAGTPPVGIAVPVVVSSSSREGVGGREAGGEPKGVWGGGGNHQLHGAGGHSEREVGKGRRGGGGRESLKNRYEQEGKKKRKRKPGGGRRWGENAPEMEERYGNKSAARK